MPPLSPFVLVAGEGMSPAVYVGIAVAVVAVVLLGIGGFKYYKKKTKAPAKDNFTPGIENQPV